MAKIAKSRARKEKVKKEKVKKFDANAGLDVDAFIKASRRLAGTKAGGQRQYQAVVQKEDAEVHSYENTTRSFNKYQREMKARLPIKTKDGLVYQVGGESEEEDDENEEEGDEVREEDDLEGSSGDGEQMVEKEVEESKGSQRQQIMEAKEELAHIALTLNEDPEENTHLFRRLREYSDSRFPTIQKLALATQLSIFKSIIPGYRIRPLTAEDKVAKVTKEVRKLRNYEQALLHSYQQYVNTLSSLSRGSPSHGGKPGKWHQPTGAQQELALVAVTCTAGLLLSVPHFNFRTDLLGILVDRLSTRTINAIHEKARNSLEELFRLDQDGAPSFDAVRLLVKMLKAKQYCIHESVLNIFLSLRLLTELDVKASQDRVDQKFSNGAGVTRKKRKYNDDSKQQFKTKRQKKLEREQATVLNELREAEAVVSHEERERMQSETLKLVFGVYLCILKTQVNGSLLAATLEGLTKFAHLVNVEFFTTLLAVLKDLIQDALSSSYFPNMSGTSSSTPHKLQTTREPLLCITAAFTLLSGQQRIVCSDPSTRNKLVVPLDLTFFTSRLFTLLLPLSLNPDLEFNHKSLWLPDPSSPGQHTMKKPHILSSSQINIATETALLTRSLSSILTPDYPPRPAPSRVAAFTKRLLSFSLQSPEKSSIASLGVIVATARKNRGPARYAVKGVFQLGEKAGDGCYRCWVPEEAMDEDNETQEQVNGLDEDWLLGVEERVNPLVGTAWEIDLLRKHYSPRVRSAVHEVTQSILG